MEAQEAIGVPQEVAQVRRAQEGQEVVVALMRLTQVVEAMVVQTEATQALREGQVVVQGGFGRCGRFCFRQFL